MRSASSRLGEGRLDRRRSTRIGPLTHIHRGPGAWTVVVTRRGRNYADYFGDAVWGGREQALVAARRFRDELLLRIEPDTRVRRRVPKGSRSRTHIVGVSLERYKVRGRFYRYVIAYWRDPEKGGQRRRFSVQRYGRERALALATEAREQGVAYRHAYELARQREEAARRLRSAPPMPRQVKDPLSRKGISMARRRPRRAK